MKTCLSGVIAAACVAAPMLGHTTTVRVNFEAEVVDFKQDTYQPPSTFIGQPIALGDKVTGVLQYETDLTNTANISGIGAYNDITSGSGLTVQFKNNAIVSKPPFCLQGTGAPLCLGSQMSTRYDDGQSFPPPEPTFGIVVSTPTTTTGNYRPYEVSLGFQLVNDPHDASLPQSLSMNDIVTGYLSLDAYGYSGGAGVLAKITQLQTVSEVPEASNLFMMSLGVGLIGWRATARRRS